MEIENVEKVNKKKKKEKTSKVISFDEEVVPKHVAEEILARESVHNEEVKIHTEAKKKTKKRKKAKKEVEDNKEHEPESLDSEIVDMVEACHVKRKKKKKKKPEVSNDTEADFSMKIENGNSESDKNRTNSDNVDNAVKKKKKRVQEININADEDNVEEHKSKKKRKVQNSNESDDPKDTEEGMNESSEPKKKESIRERKRKKYAQLLKDKKMETELALQQKSLNYLSKWKHSKREWKFEKLRQIWLQQNMFDSSKVPQEFWESLVEYFGQSKGKARDVILKAAVKIIEEEKPEGEEEEKEGDETQVKIERARDIIQNLQE